MAKQTIDVLTEVVEMYMDGRCSCEQCIAGELSEEIGFERVRLELSKLQGMKKIEYCLGYYRPTMESYNEIAPLII